MAKNTHPFDKQDLLRINQALDSLTESKKIIQRAKAAGFDVDAYDTDCDACIERLQGIKREYFTLKAGQ